MMAFDLRSFLMGWGVGLVTRPVAHRLRPLMVELATAAGQLADSASVGMAQQGERLQDLLEEAKAAFGGSRAKTGERKRSSPSGARSRSRSSAGSGLHRARGRRRAAAPKPASTPA
jgi:hypothetical protein